MAKGTDYKLNATKNYRLFSLEGGNRSLELSKRSDLRHSMQHHGFLPAYPLHCIRKAGRLFVKDGQHRLAISEELGLAVWYVVCDDEADIAELNNTQKRWTIQDYCARWTSEGLEDYAKLTEFSITHGISISICVAILGDQTNGANLSDKFRRGEFKIRSADKAERIARLYTQLGAINRSVQTRYLIGALFAVCLVHDIDDKRLIAGARRCPEALTKYGTRDGFLAMLEEAYNFGQRTRYPLKISAENAIRARTMVANPGEKLMPAAAK